MPNINGVNVNINERTIDNCAQSTVDVIDTPIKKIVDESLTSLKIAASELLHVMEGAQVQLNIFKDANRHISQIAKATKAVTTNMKSSEIRGLYSETEEYKKYKSLVDNFYMSGWPDRIVQSVLKVQTEANRALGQEIETIFVYQDKNRQPELYRLGNITDFLRYDRTSRTYNLTARFGTLRSHIEDLQSARLSQDLFDPNVNISNLDQVYRSVMTAYKKSKVKRVMWLNPSPPPKWRVEKVSSAGDINEAYATILLQHSDKKRFEGSFNENTEEFMEIVSKVGGVSGLLQGDITVGKTEYAIKSADASIAGITQTIKFAKEILSDGFDLQKLQEKKRALAKSPRHRNHIQSMLEEAVSKDIIEVVSAYNLTK